MSGKCQLLEPEVRVGADLDRLELSQDQLSRLTGPI